MTIFPKLKKAYREAFCSADLERNYLKCDFKFRLEFKEKGYLDENLELTPEGRRIAEGHLLGRPIGQYHPQTLRLKPNDIDWSPLAGSSPTWIVSEFEGGIWHCDNHAMFRGEKPDNAPESVRKPKFYKVVAPHLERAKGDVYPIAASNRENGDALIWFTNGKAIDGKYYDYALRLFPDLTWKATEATKETVAVFFGFREGEFVALVMPLDGEPPKNVQALLDAKKGKELS